MKRRITINHKEYEMPKLTVDDYMEYLELAEEIDSHKRYTKQDIEVMMMFICKAYDNQFTIDELKDHESGLDIAGIVVEFQFIDMSVAEELTKKMEKIEKNFQRGK